MSKTTNILFCQQLLLKIAAVSGSFPAYIVLVKLALLSAIFNYTLSQSIRKTRLSIGKKTSLPDVFAHIYAYGAFLIDQQTIAAGKFNSFSCKVTGAEILQSMLDKKKGVVIVGANIGNPDVAWELISRQFSSGNKIIIADVKTAQEEYRAALTNNAIVCMMGDSHSDAGHQSHDFLDGKQNFPLLPFTCAAETGAAVIVVIVTKTGQAKYTVKFHPAIQFDAVTPENRDKYVFTAVERYVGILEQAIKQNPVQWLNSF